MIGTARLAQLGTSRPRLSPSRLPPSRLPFPLSCPDCSPRSFSSAASSSRSWPRWWASGSRSCTATTSRRSCGASAAIHWAGLRLGVGLASLDWIGGGLRHWVCARHVLPRPSLKGMILAGGMGAWAGFITPLNSGAGPMTMYTLRRYGIPLPVGVAATFMSFVSTVLFFAIAGPLAVAFGAGKSLGPAGQRAGAVAVRPVQGQPDDRGRHRRPDGDRHRLSPDGSGPDPSGRRSGSAGGAGGWPSDWSGCSRASTSCTRAWWPSTAPADGSRSSGARC